MSHNKRQYPIDQSNQLNQDPSQQQQYNQQYNQQPQQTQPQYNQTPTPQQPYNPYFNQQTTPQQTTPQQTTPQQTNQQQQQNISPPQQNNGATLISPVHGSGKRVYPVDPANEAVLTSGFNNMNISSQQPQPQYQQTNTNTGFPQTNTGYPQTNTGYPQTNTGIPSPSSSQTQPYQPYQQQQTLPMQNGLNTQPYQQQPQPQSTTTTTFVPSYPQPQQTQQLQNNQPWQPQPQPQYQSQPQQPQYQPQPQQPQYQPQPQQQTPQQMQQVEPPVPTLENLCPKTYMRLSMNAIPNQPSLLSKIHIPFGLNIHPLAQDQVNPVPVVYTSIIRCKRCRTYISPFVTWLNNGAKWRCCVCENINDTPQDYYSPIDYKTGLRQDINNRPELKRGCVEYLASNDYTIRAPQPPTYFFIIDVCYESIVSGMLNTAINAIRTTLDDLEKKGNGRTRFGIMTFDDSLHFYNLKNSPSNRPQMFVVTDLDQVYVPPFEDFLVNLKDARQVIDNTLTIIQNQVRTQQKVESCLGSALKAAFSICERVGGKLIVMQSYIPRGPIGKLSIREYQPLLGTKKEVSLLQPSTDGEFYKELALSCTSQQLSVDMFLFSNDYTDTASLGSLCQITGGQMYYYPSFVASRDGQVFAANLIHCLQREIAWEAVMRVRTSRGLTINSYHGNYFLKNSDLLGLPTMDSDKTITLQLGITDSIGSRYACLQSALLYTHSSGDRRVRVFTISIPVVNNYQDLFKYADISVVTSLISKMAIDKALSSSLNDARDAIANKCVEILQAFKSISANTGGSGGVTLSQNAPKLLLPETLKHLPLYVVAMVKNLIFSSRITNPDLRSFHMQRMKSLDLNSCLNFFYPYFYSLTIPPNYQPPSPDQPFIPHSCKLASDQLSRNGLFAIVNGYTIYIYIGEAMDPQVFSDVFGCDQSSLDINTFQDFPILDNENNRYARKVIEHSRASYQDYLKLFLVPSNDKQRKSDFQSLLIEDRTPEGCSYYEFIIQLQSRVQQN